MFKRTLFVCLQALLIQGFSAQCLGPYNGYAADDLAWTAGNPLAWDNGWSASNPLALESVAALGAAAPCASAVYAAGAGPNYSAFLASPAFLSASNGGGLAVTSASPIAATGVTMTSENAYEGPLSVAGTIPFLGAVALEGALPTDGAGAVSYACGNGNVAMINEDYAGYGVGPLGFEAGISAPAYGLNGLAGPVAEAALPGAVFAAGTRFGGCGCGATY
ncbi:chorion class B protein PC10-like [Danaus plexippus]|uniref:chorion class B protein PC10-like n=1 Tax=Danaus plexippus TaxID=13037 RepID=UPI002AB0E6E5|nr:chorion class B protein PC10-like [Danaus plexippus]